ncbi:hypothetical protein BT96DRAFT_941697 [Gymnopus androsaceus JB14]|uniref:MFS general substrate transporter n=1 Tax=Gymnopus androsaceus JB14 TaxID=1447944 RepID=A0A6A4HFE6_9AGAR|nr:hypothetical protein BT96DRAFT_941697 [Gymnopus androsaceus JB14]
MSEPEGTSSEVLNTDWYWRGIRLKYYCAPLTQVALVGLIAFMTVGMSNALGGAGGGGLLNTHQSTNANVAIYSTFAALAFFAGTIYNKIGIRMTLMFGGFGYALLASAYMAAAHLENKATPYIVIAGCVEGLCAAMLWTAQGAVTMAYPTEDMKGRAFSLFWGIFRMGGVIGSIIPICLNWNTGAGNMTDGTSFLGFFCLPIGSFGAMVTRVVLPEIPTWRQMDNHPLPILALPQTGSTPSKQTTSTPQTLRFGLGLSMDFGPTFLIWRAAYSTQSKRYAPYLMIYVFWSFYDGAFQAYAYWLMGSLSNNSRRLSHYSGWYKSLQSAGAAVVWRLDGLEISYVSMYLSTWMIMVFALITASYVAFNKVQPHTYDEPHTNSTTVWTGSPSQGIGEGYNFICSCVH